MSQKSTISNQNKDTPQLRFPEFTDAWQVKKLGDVADKGEYGMNAAAKPFDGTNRYLRITDIDDQTRKIIMNGVTSPSGTLEDKYLLQWNDIVFARTGASTGKTYFYNTQDGKTYFAGFLIRFRVNKATPYFVYLQTLRGPYDKWVAMVSARSGQPGVNAEEYSTYKFYLPQKPEQQKITDFLTVVDDRIAASEKKLELLKSYKKGVMQKIFTQVVRFKDENGNPYPEWEKKRLGDVADFVNGYTFLSSTYVEGGKYRVITIANVQQGAMNVDSANTIDSLPVNIQKSQILHLGDILISMTGNVGRVCLVDAEDCLLNQRVGKLVPRDINKDYLYQCINTPRFVSKMISSGQGGAQDNLSSKDIKSYSVALPTLEEQQKIATFLTALDAKIAAEQTRLTAAKQWKKGLLQRMFV